MSKLNFLVVGLLVGVSFSSFNQPGLAQVNSTSGEYRDPFSSASQGDTTGLLRILNGLQNGKLTSEQDFLTQQRVELTGSTQDFRAQQLRRLREQQSQPKK